MNASVNASNGASLSAQTARADRRHAERPSQGASRADQFAQLMQAQTATEAPGAHRASATPRGGLKNVAQDNGEGADASVQRDKSTPSASADRLEGQVDPAWLQMMVPGLNAAPVVEKSAGVRPEPTEDGGQETQGDPDDEPADRPSGVTGRAKGRGGAGGRAVGADASGSSAVSPSGAEGLAARSSAARSSEAGHGDPRGGQAPGEKESAVEPSRVGSADAREPVPASAADAPGQGPLGASDARVQASPDAGSFAAQLLAARSGEAVTSEGPAVETPRSAHAVFQANDPEFPGQVALKVAEWSASGIQQATLDLHPAELGPIQIRIDLDGENASIRFGAAHERTRALLDEALPALAVALQSDGLSLAASQVSDVVKPLEHESGGVDVRRERESAGGEGASSSADPGSDGRPRPVRVSDVGLSTFNARAQAAQVWLPGGADGSAPSGPAASNGRLRLDLYA